ncbi:MAG TPA: GGDEF domain-containing protein [Dongiaceae bacterium]|nr:GGDEF domain-containing protein [Dongiaceae bacterium]
MVNRVHRKILQTFASRTPAMTLLYCSIMLLFIGWLDIITGDYSLIVFYLIPVSLVAWFVGKRSGMLFCLMATVVRIVADESTNSSLFAHSVLHYWNVLAESLFLLIMSLLFSALKKNLENEKELARRDPLTDTLNRRSFFDLGEHEINRSHRYDLPLTVAYIDIDNFKSINDRLGHQAGDELLITVVSAIRSHMRSSDILARFGGDEFVILLPDTSGDAAQTFLNKMRDNLDQAMARKGWPAGFSIGAATYVHAPATIYEVIRSADELMYAVKHSSKNRLLHKVIGEVSHG